MSLRIIKAGMLTTLQDLGRTGYQHLGVPVGGAMDELSMRTANILCGNKPVEAVLEFNFHGAELLPEKDVLVAFAGGGARVFVDEDEITLGKLVHIKAYSLLRLLPCSRGIRLYMAVAGGFDITAEMGSCSTYLPAHIGGFHGRALQNGDLVPLRGGLNEYQLKATLALGFHDKNYHMAGWGVPPPVNEGRGDKIVRVIQGAEWDLFMPSAKHDFLHTPFYISGQFDRMGYRLLGNLPARAPEEELLSTAVTRGTIQVTHNGQLVLLMSDAQTTGGYPRIGQVAAADLPVCAQMRPGESIRFTLLSQVQAEDLLYKRELALKHLEEYIHDKF